MNINDGLETIDLDVLGELGSLPIRDVEPSGSKSKSSSSMLAKVGSTFGIAGVVVSSLAGCSRDREEIPTPTVTPWTPIAMKSVETAIPTHTPWIPTATIKPVDTATPVPDTTDEVVTATTVITATMINPGGKASVNVLDAEGKYVNGEPILSGEVVEIIGVAVDSDGNALGRYWAISSSGQPIMIAPADFFTKDELGSVSSSLPVVPYDVALSMVRAQAIPDATPIPTSTSAPTLTPTPTEVPATATPTSTATLMTSPTITASIPVVSTGVATSPLASDQGRIEAPVGNNVNMREEPCIEPDNINGSFGPGTIVKVLGRTEVLEDGYVWAKVQDGNGQLGWVRGDLIVEPTQIEVLNEPEGSCSNPTTVSTFAEVGSVDANSGSVISAESLGDFSFSIIGVPEVATNYEVASGDFKNTIQNGTQIMFAEPGKLLISDYAELAVAMGISVEDAVRFVQQSGGAIELINPDNQQELVVEGQAFNLPGGGFGMVSANHGRIELSNGMVVEFDGGERANVLVFMRGRYGDGMQDTDENLTGKFFDFAEGHGLYMRWSGQPNGGFISEGQGIQVVADSHTGSTNNGDAGASTVFIINLDTNTGAYSVTRQSQTGGESDPSTYKPLASNFVTRQ